MLKTDSKRPAGGSHQVKLSFHGQPLCPMYRFRFVAEIECHRTQLVRGKVLYETMAGCLESPAIISKIVPCCRTQTLEKLVVGVRQRQMSVIFPKLRIIVFRSEEHTSELQSL